MDAMPRGTSIVTYEAGTFLATCRCDWTGTLAASRQEAIADAVEHARTSTWCCVHRNLTPAGADPVMGETPRR